ncbi:MAG: hypothetical protein Ct9H300mP23_00850 [Nitrospinota bacterium]|nr:MAG: hypothetical protein Ct9H300mP23_00850 [Nitrospinota bacterium]
MLIAGDLGAVHRREVYYGGFYVPLGKLDVKIVKMEGQITSPIQFGIHKIML